MVKNWTPEEHAGLRREVPRLALNTPFGSGCLGDVALDVLEIAHEGLSRRARLDGVGLDETHFLMPLFHIAESGFTPAEELLAAFDRRWRGEVDPVFKEYAY
jgi:glutamate--cysteine ligase